MSEDELKRSLESLFSDVPVPTAVPEDAEAEGEPSELIGLETKPLPEVTESDLEIEDSEEAVSPLTEEADEWRPRLLQVLTYGAAAIGAPLVALNAYQAYASGQVALIPFWLSSYLILLLITFVGWIPYRVKVGTFLALMYGVSLFDLIRAGQAGSNRMLLLTIPILAVVLLGQSAGIVILLIASATHAVSAWAVSTQRFVPVGPGAVSGAPGAWWWTSPVVFFLIGAALLFAETRLLPRLAAATKRRRKLERDLAEYQARLGGQRRELRRRALQLEAGVELGRAITSTLDVEELLERTVGLIPDYFGCYFSAVFLLDATGEQLVLRCGTGDVGAQLATEEFQLEIGGSSIVGWTAKHKVSYVALDAEKNDRYQPHPLLPDTGSEVTLPLLFNDQLLGVLDVQAKETSAFDETDIRVLRGIADQLAVAIQNARHISDEGPFLEATSALYRASRRLTRATTTDDVVRAIIDSVGETEAGGCVVAEFVRSPGGELEGLQVASSWYEQGESWLRPRTHVSLTESPLPLELLDGSLTVTNVRTDERLSQSARAKLGEMGVGSFVSVPLRGNQGSIGQIVVLSRETGSLPGSSMQLLEVLGIEAAPALERARLLEEAQQGAQQEWKLRRIVDRIRQATDVEQALRAAAGELSDAMDVPHVSIELDVDSDEEREADSPSPED